MIEFLRSGIKGPLEQFEGISLRFVERDIPNSGLLMRTKAEADQLDERSGILVDGARTDGIKFLFRFPNVN